MCSFWVIGPKFVYSNPLITFYRSFITFIYRLLIIRFYMNYLSARLLKIRERYKYSGSKCMRKNRKDDKFYSVNFPSLSLSLSPAPSHQLAFTDLIFNRFYYASVMFIGLFIFLYPFCPNSLF